MNNNSHAIIYDNKGTNINNSIISITMWRKKPQKKKKKKQKQLL